jgi:hypothetical protein
LGIWNSEKEILIVLDIMYAEKGSISDRGDRFKAATPAVIEKRQKYRRPEEPNDRRP